MIVGLSFFNRTRFILTIGDEGAVLCLVEGKQLKARLFAHSCSQEDYADFSKLLAQYATVPISILLDTIEQSYTRQVLPAVSPWIVNKLVKRRLKQDFDPLDIKGAILLGREVQGRKDWNYIFVNTPITENLSAWLEYVASLANRCVGIYMLPLEMQSLVRQIGRAVGIKPKEWQFIVTYNKVSGFRQVVLHKGKTIFTRVVKLGKDRSPDIVAGNVEQEILNTLDYLHRLSFSDEQDIDIVIVAAREILGYLEGIEVRGNTISLYTPFQLAQLLHFKNTAYETDKFADVLMVVAFASVTRPVLKLHTVKTGLLERIYYTSFAVVTATKIMAMIALIYVVVMVIGIYRMNNDIKEIGSRKTHIQKEWQKVKYTGEYSIDAANIITDVVALHQDLQQQHVTPLHIIDTLREVKGKNNLVSSLSWVYSKAKKNKEQSGDFSMIFNIDYFHDGGNVEALLRNFDMFTEAIKKAFAGYYVEHSKLPDRIVFGEENRIIKVQVMIRHKAEG